MGYDLIIITQSKDKELIQITKDCIKSAKQDNVELNVIIVESGNPYRYNVNTIVEYNGEFNYNRALNLGLRHIKHEYQILANNDILFTKGWSEIGNIMKANNYLSASALSNDQRHNVFSPGDFAYEGYMIGYHVTGWCLFAHRSVWEKIGKLDETYKFWYSDNIYAEQLKKEGIVHALICSVRVDHLGSKTLSKQDPRTQRDYTYNMGKLARSLKILK